MYATFKLLKSSCKKEAWKKFRLERDPTPLAPTPGSLRPSLQPYLHHPRAWNRLHIPMVIVCKNNFKSPLKSPIL